MLYNLDSKEFIKNNSGRSDIYIKKMEKIVSMPKKKYLLVRKYLSVYLVALPMIILMSIL